MRLQWFSFSAALSGLILAATNLAGAQMAPSPGTCTQPNVPARTLTAAVPQYPGMAAIQHITGTVEVKVSLDPDSNIVATSIVSSPSALLNNEALHAARTSTFRTETRDCIPVASSYVFNVTFTQGGPVSGPPALDTVRETGEGDATETVTGLDIDARVLSADESLETAIGKDRDALAAFQQAAAGASMRTSLSTSYVPPELGAARRGFIELRFLHIESDGIAAGFALAGKLRALAGPNLSLEVSYHFADESLAYSRAFAVALDDARTKATADAAARHRPLGSLRFAYSTHEAKTADSSAAPGSATQPYHLSVHVAYSLL